MIPKINFEEDNQYDQQSYDLQTYSQFLTPNFASTVLDSDQTNETVIEGSPTSISVNRESDLATPLSTAQADSAISFSDVSVTAGLELVTQTWGSTWGDYDGDGWIDLWLNRHQLKPILYRNQGDGTFLEVTDLVFQDDATRGDFHGAVFVDVNNDGSQDLIQLAGGDQGAEDTNPNKEKKLYINENGKLINRSVELGVDYLTGRGRVPVPLDINNDGLLDYVFTGPPRNDGTAPPTLFLQNPGGTFQNIGEDVQLSSDVPSGTFAVVSDLTGDGTLELIYAASSPRLTIYDTTAYQNSGSPLVDITDQLLPSLQNLNNIQDVAVGDFNGDGRQDMFIVRQGSSSSGVRFDGSLSNETQSGRVRLLISKAMQRGIRVETAGSVNLNFQGDPTLDLPQFMQDVGITPDQIKIGVGAYSPDSLIFSVDAFDANGQELGIPDYTPGVDKGVYIGYAGGYWQITLSNNGFDEVSFLYDFTEKINQFDAINYKLTPDRQPYQLLINTEDGFVDRSNTLILDDSEISASNVVSGDFDNDGDLDLYIVATDLTQNQPNVLLENKNGSFETVIDAGGALGTRLGLGDGVGLADYDNDGDLDFFVTNGDVAGFRRPFLMDGSNQLFQNNLNNGNHWLLIDLEGRRSNRDAIGARVEVTSGGITQVREQNGGIHNRAQNDKRLHFGLADQSQIEKIEIYWPSGQVDVLSNVAANQILKIEEGSGLVTGEGAGGGKQIIEGTNAGDVLTGTEGMNVMRGLGGADDLSGLDGDDNLLGNGGIDTLRGGNGSDLLVGNQGNDVLIGGAGRDKFLFNSEKDKVDTIVDFSPQDDFIRLRADNFGGDLAKGTLGADEFHIGSRATQSNQRVIYDKQSGALWFDADGNGAIAAHQFATLQGSPDLLANNIVTV